MIRPDDRGEVGLPWDDRELELRRAAQVRRVADQAATAEARRRMPPAPAPVVRAVHTGQE